MSNNEQQRALLQEAAEYVEIAAKFLKYQRPGKEFYPNREGAEACLGRIIQALTPTPAPSDAPAGSFPNPLQINFGEGRILIERFTDKDGGHGICLKDTGEPHPVNVVTDTPPVKGHIPTKGEIYLRFANADSVMAVVEPLSEIVVEMLGLPSGLSKEDSDKLFERVQERLRAGDRESVIEEGKSGVTPGTNE